MNDIGDCGDDDRRTFFQEPGWNGIRITLLNRTIEQDLRDFIFRVGLKKRNQEELPVVKVSAEK